MIDRWLEREDSEMSTQKRRTEIEGRSLLIIPRKKKEPPRAATSKEM